MGVVGYSGAAETLANTACHGVENDSPAPYLTQTPISRQVYGTQSLLLCSHDSGKMYMAANS